MTFWSLTDYDLVDITLWAKDEPVKGVSVFPFFSESNQVKLLMILLPDLPAVSMVPFNEGLISVSLLSSISFLRSIKLSMDLAEIKSYTNFTGGQVKDLCHYDPHCMLSHERFSTYWARELIQQTNCTTGNKEKVNHLLFSRDLSVLKGVVIQIGSPKLSFKTENPQKIFNRPYKIRVPKEVFSSKPRRHQWMLDPIWNNWGNGGK
jgi:hypothetical protein